MIRAARLVLAPLTEDDRAAHRAMTADPEVMWDYGGPFSPQRSAEHFARHLDAFAVEGFGRWAVRGAHDGAYLGYCGVNRIWPTLPIAPGWEIGWRLTRVAWGHGYATEAAQAALRDLFARTDADEVLAYTSPDNSRSLSVMRKLGFHRDAARDFTYVEHEPEGGPVSVVYVAPRADWS